MSTPPSTAPVERARFPLVLKLFGVTALLIALVIGIAIGITIHRANIVAGETVNRSIAGAAGLYADLEREELQRLALPVKLLGYDPNVVALFGRALDPGQTAEEQAAPEAQPTDAPASGPVIDLVDLNDQLEQRRVEFKSDLMILLDSEGRVVTRTDRPSLTSVSGEDLYEQSPIVKRIVDEDVDATTGVIDFGGKLYHAAAAPIGVGTPRVKIAYFVNASAIDEEFANRIAGSTNAGVMLAGRTGTATTRSSNAPPVGMQQISATRSVFNSGKPLAPVRETIDRDAYVLTAQPLKAGTQTVGAAVFLRSLDRELAPFREIQRTLLIGGGLALLLAFILSWLIAKRTTRPIEQLARMAQAVTAGDYSVRPDSTRSDEVGILGRSFAKMISSLRDKAELEELYAEMAARSAEREARGREPEAAKLDEGTILVTDLRGLPATVGDGDAAKVITAVARAMKLQENEVLRQEGIVREIVGHRLVCVFRGDRGTIHAIRAARAINEELATHDKEAPMSVGVGIASGEFVTGSVELSHESGLAIVGNAPLLALLFAWHAPSGVAYISTDTAQAAGSEIAGAVTREEVRLKWLNQPLPVASLSLVNVTTGMMRGVGTQTASMATLKLGGNAASPQPVLDLAPGLMFASRYRIEQIIGRGGMGIVYRATDQQLDETVAIKTLTGDVLQRSPEDLERFKREIRLARKITHRNVLRTFDYGEADGVYFISMEFVRGYTLSELLNEAPARQMAPRVVMGISRQVCRGLQAAHEQGIIHRDIKPGNVLIDAKGEVKLMDFGIARMAEAPESMTQAGLIIGTPHYMSPEQVRGESLDARSDVYAMGVLMYEMLGGRRPFEASSLTGVLTAHITEVPRPLIELRPAVSDHVNSIVMRCLSKKPGERYADAGALLAELDGVQVAVAVAA